MRLFKRSNGIYYIKIFDESGNEIKRVSTKKKKKNEALKFLSEYEQKNKPIKLNLTLKKFRNLYIEYVEKSKSKSYKRNVDNSFNFLESSVNEQDLIKDLKPNYLETAFLELFTKSKHASATYHRILKSAFNKAIQWNYISFNPFTGFKIPKIEKKFPAYLTKPELNVILSNTKNETLREIFSILFHTGMRINELLHLTWGDVNLQEKTIKVSNTKEFTTKNKKERIIPMNTVVNDILLSKLSGGIKQKECYIFTKFADIKFSSEYISKRFKEVVRKTDLDKSLHLHSLRHSFCSNLVSKNISLYTVKELAGHEDISTTAIYSHVQFSALAKAVNSLD